MNVVVVRGTVARVQVRALGDGGSLCSFDVRAAGKDGPASVPVAWFSAPGSAPSAVSDGDEVVVTGEVRRRFFRTGSATASRTEVVAHDVVAVRARARARAAVERAIARLG